MAKKTSYLTELIERHERWKAEGGERLEEEEQAVSQDLYAVFKFQNPSCLLTSLTFHIYMYVSGPRAVILKTCGTLGLSDTLGERSGVPTRSKSRGHL